jgi:hypothetical protein
MKRVIVIILMGVMWFGVGFFLLYKGLFLMMQAITFHDPKNVVLLSLMKKLIPSQENAAILLLSIGLFLGMMKGRFVLTKTAKKTVSKILQIPEPIKLKEIFPVTYLLLIAGMMSLGMLMNICALSFDIRSMVDVAVGSALIQGGVYYLRSAFQLKLYGKEIP